MKLRPRRVGQRLSLIENTPETLVMAEQPHYVYSAFFSFSGLIILGIALSRRMIDGRRAPFLISVAACFLALGLWGAVRSTFILSYFPAMFRIRRQLGWIRFSRDYPMDDVKRVYEWSSLRGSLLRMEMANGRKRNLTLWADHLGLGGQAALLNHFMEDARAPRFRS